MSFYNKTDSDALKAKFADLSKPTGADFASLIDYIDSALKGLDGETTTTTTSSTTVAPTTTTTSSTTTK